MSPPINYLPLLSKQLGFLPEYPLYMALFAPKKIDIAPDQGCFYNFYLIVLNTYRGPTLIPNMDLSQT
jgi:hypothetical protein